MATEWEEYNFKFLGEYDKSFRFEIESTGNKPFLPKSHCQIETEDYDLVKGKIYKVFVTEWISNKNNLKQGGIKEVVEFMKILVEVAEKREKAIKIEILTEEFHGLGFWVPISQIKNNDKIPNEKKEFEMIMADWALNKKIKEAREESQATGRRIIKKKKSASEIEDEEIENQSNQNIPPYNDMEEDDIPF